MQHKKTPKGGTKRKEREDDHHKFKEVVEAASATFRLGLIAQRKNDMQSAFDEYDRVPFLLMQLPFKEWRRSEFIQAMQAIECSARLIEAGYFPSTALIPVAKEACRIYHDSPGIQCIDFRMTALRMLLARYQVFWNDEILTNDVAPLFNVGNLDTIEQGYTSIRKSIKTDNEQTTEKKNLRLSLLARSYIMLGSAWLRIAYPDKAIAAYLIALQDLAEMTAKDDFYIDSLYVIFHTLNMHINFDNQFPLLRFARRLLSEDTTANPDFVEFAALFMQMENHPVEPSPVSIELWRAFIAVLQQRIGKGKFSLGENASYPADFNDNPFWEALENPVYQARLKDMQFKLKNGIRPLSTIIPKPPALPLPNYIPECIAPVPMMLEEPFEFGNNGEILPELPEFSCSFEERDFMFFNSQVFSSPPLSRKSKCVGDETPTKQWPAGDEDLDATPTQDSKLGFQFP